MNDPIKLNDILRIEDIVNCKIRFLTNLGKVTNPLDYFRNNDKEELLKWLFWNYGNNVFAVGQTVIGLVRIEGDKWLLFNISKITARLGILRGVGYEYEEIDEYSKYFGRVIIEYENRCQHLIRKAESVLDECVVSQILEQVYEDDSFPGYDAVNLSWMSLKRVIKTEVWKTALGNQKGVYLITDVTNGKLYVGSAYGGDMIYGRWLDYTKNGHGGNVGLKSLDFDYIKNNFRYSILETYRSTTDDDFIIDREGWWKNVLQSRSYGYNEN